MLINLRKTHYVSKLFVQSNSAATQESFILLESKCDNLISTGQQLYLPHFCVILIPCHAAERDKPNREGVWQDNLYPVIVSQVNIYCISRLLKFGALLQLISAKWSKRTAA